MGQKTNASIFRQGLLKKNWEIKTLEKNKEESSFFLYKTLEIQKYINRFFGLYEIKIHNCKIFYSDNSLQIFVSFYATIKTIYIINKKVVKKIKPSLKDPKLKNNKNKIRTTSKNLQKITQNKTFSFHKNEPNQNIYFEKFQELLIQSLAIYTKNKTNIFITLQNLNLDKQLSNDQVNNFKNIFKQLRKFVRKSFFKEGINILFVSFLKRKSAKLLADFLSSQFRLNQFKTYEMSIARKDNYFLGFLKQSIMLLIKSKTSCLTGLKIVIKGRFNKAPRAKTGNIHFGKFSLQSFNSKIDYHQSTAFTVNGTFGVKVWLCESN